MQLRCILGMSLLLGYFWQNWQLDTVLAHDLYTYVNGGNINKEDGRESNEIERDK